MEDDSPGIVTEYLPGTLLALLEQHATQPPASSADRAAIASVVPYPLVCKVGRQLAETLQFLHRRDVRSSL